MNVDTSCNDFRRDNHESFCNTRGVFCRAMGVSTRTTFLFSILPTAQQHIWLQKCISSLEVVSEVVSEVAAEREVATETEETERREGSVSKTET